MPPRKSNISQVSATDPDGAGTPHKERDGINIEVQPTSQSHIQFAPQFYIPFRPLLPGPPPGIPQLTTPPHGTPNMVADSDTYGPQDLSLPKTMVQRLAKGVLPPNTSLGKDAIVAMQKGATVFINYLAQAANTSTTNANKRTIPPRAVLEALVDLEFEPFVPRVEAELEKYNEVQVGKRNEYRRKVKEEKMGGVKGEEGGSGVEAEAEAEEEEEGRATKRVRREEGEGGVGDGHEQLLVGNGYAEREEEEGDEELEGNADEGADDGDDDTANTSRELRPRRSEEAEDDEEEDEEEDDDEDEYPDEGRRLSSVEREAHEGGDTRSPRYDDPNDEEEEDEEGLSDVSD